MISSVAFSKAETDRVSARTLAKVQRGMARDGAIRFENLLPLSLLKRARREVERRRESGELLRRGLIRDIGGRYAAVVPFEGPFLDPRFYANPRLTAVLGALLGPGYCIGSLEAVTSRPGASGQHQHIDGPIRFDRQLGRAKRPYARDLSDLPPYAVSLCVPLCDLDEENGPTAIWPGSHKPALRARPPGAREVARRYPEEHMDGKFGRTFMFDYRVFHGGTPNYSREPRTVMMFVFTRPWFRDPNLNEVQPSVVISKRNLARVAPKHRDLFLLAPAARRALWSTLKEPS